MIQRENNKLDLTKQEKLDLEKKQVWFRTSYEYVNALVHNRFHEDSIVKSLLDNNLLLHEYDKWDKRKRREVHHMIIPPWRAFEKSLTRMGVAREYLDAEYIVPEWYWTHILEKAYLIDTYPNRVSMWRDAVSDDERRAMIEEERKIREEAERKWLNK